MRIADIEIRTVRWPIDPRGAARGRTERAAAIIAIRDESGATGLGETAPLPGMSIETLADAAEDLRRAAAQLRGASVPTATLGAVERAQLATTPAGRFAIETALLVLLAQRACTSVAALYNANPPRTLDVAVVVDDPDEARAAVHHGARCLKIKAGDLAIVERIARAVPGARLRVDANRSWPQGEVLARLTELAALPIDFVEEPCVDAHELLAAPLPCRIALDESLASLDPAWLSRALRSPDLAALILKPTLLGGFARCLQLAAVARRHDVLPIVTHALEGPIGTAACFELARAIGGNFAVGLAPHPGVARFAEAA